MSKCRVSKGRKNDKEKGITGRAFGLKAVQGIPGVIEGQLANLTLYKGPKCCGLGKIENPAWYPIWATRSDLKDSFQILETKEKLTIAEETAPDQPDEPIFFICKKCHGRGKILTNEGKQLMEFVRFWLNPNY
ncbi:hypothetical protein DSOL_3602 [Desulfosporosinus metallidurans]|uniref:Uncharacterized protein n=1 Tax=Desulfosporosinus metallidurans TaxID=1888891 RepID=A0A1Q8QPJ6_9FIRM|nr:hypothetical protein DSOL_3602 [Desulfosporosinus metallidurans]